MEEEDVSEFHCGLRLTEDYFDEDEDDEEVVIFDLPKEYRKHNLIRENGTPESSYDSDTASERSSTPTCCNLISCRDKTRVKSNISIPRSNQQQSIPRAEVRFNLVPMENPGKESIKADDNGSQEKDIDTTYCDLANGRSPEKYTDTHDKSCSNSENEARSDSTEDNISDLTKENTTEKDLNNHKDNNSEKNQREINQKEGEIILQDSISCNSSKDISPVEDSNKYGKQHKEIIPSASGIKGKSHVRKKTVYSYEEIIVVLEEKLQSLLKRENYICVDGRAELKFVRRTTRYSPDVVLNRRIVDKIIKLGIAHVFVKVWKSVNSVDFMDYDKYACAFKNLQTALSIVWNCTDKSVQLCESLVKTHVLHDMIAEIGSDKVSGTDLKNENNLYLVKAYLGILHNIVRLCSDSRKIFRSAKAVKILQWYLNSSNDLIKTKSYLILSYIINEEENDIINAMDDNIQFIVDILKEALESENHFSKTFAFWASEIVCGLNHLAVNESNKIRIGQCGAIPLYIQLLKEGSQEEQVLASAGLWIMAFKEENKMLLRDDPSFLDVIKNLTESGLTENVRRAARGILWVIKSAPNNEVPEMVTPEDADMPHIMVSYHHKSSQRMMIKVTRRLRAANYKVWMDLDDMHGSTLEAMALAIERSCVILVCMTQGYKDSPSCRTEAEYTYMQKKQIVPLLLQDAYRPDGWLGAFVGARLHFDFSSEEKLGTEIHKLIHELGSRGRLPRKHRRSNSPSVRSFEAGGASLMSSFSGSSIHSYTTCRLVSVTAWNSEDIQAWLQSHTLSHIQDRFSDFNGELLLQLKKMMTTAPEYFYHTLEAQLRFDLVTSLKFAKILEDVT